MKINTAIVTGSTGMIGRALVRTLVENNIKVYALKGPAFAADDEVFGDPLVTVVDADISETAAAADKITEKCDALFHFAWLGTFGGMRDDAYLQNDNIRYTIDACALAKATGCSVFVGAGSQAECGPVTEKLTPNTPANPVTGYGTAKFAAGKLSRLYCEANGIRHCWTRILSVYGVGMNPATLLPSAIGKVLRGEHAGFTKGEQDWDYLYCDDCALAFLRIAENGKDGKTYPVGSGRTEKLRVFIEKACYTADENADIAFGEVPYNPGQAMYLCADISELAEDTGFAPRVPFEEGIKKVIDEIRSRQ